MDHSIDGDRPRISDDQPPEERNAPREATLLGSFDVFALIVNKMIGTGIYSAPTTVFLLTKNKQVSLGLWAVGFFYTIMSMFIYLDYAAVFPYTGGEIVYIDEITSANNPPAPPPLRASQLPAGGIMPANGGYREQLSPARPTFPLQPPHQNPPRGFLGRIFGDGLLAYTVYAFLFVAVFNSGENLLWIGNEVLVAISPDETPNKDLTRFIGIFCLMMICLIQLFSSRAGRVLNGFFALVKLMFLFILFCFGLQAAHNNQGDTEFTQNNGDVTSSEYISALLVVMYSFEGWENATFVAGEISTEDPSILRKGFIWAVAVVGIFYMALNAVFLGAINYSNINNVFLHDKNYIYGALFEGNSPSAERGWSIILAISAAGNANTVTYTFTRVKQSIGHMNILPWSGIWKRDYVPHPDRNGDRHKTPLGGLLLEFIGTVVILCATSRVPGAIEFIIVPGNIQTVAHCVILLILGLGIFRLRSRERNLNVMVRPSWFPRVSRWFWPFQIVFILIYTGMNGFIFIGTAKIKSDAASLDYYFQGKYYVAIVLPIVAVAILYYWLVFSAYVPEPFWRFSLMKAGNVQCVIDKQPVFDMENEEARRFGHRRVIDITLRGSKPKWKAWIFWFFGGDLDHSPIDAFEDQWTTLNRNINTTIDRIKEAFTRARPVTRGSLGDSDLGQGETHQMTEGPGRVEYHASAYE